MTVPDVKKGNKRHLKLSEISDVRDGRIGKVFDRYKLKKNELFKEAHSFSIIGNKRTLDLEATVEIEARLFIGFLRVLIANQKHQEEKIMNKSTMMRHSEKLDKQT